LRDSEEGVLEIPGQEGKFIEMCRAELGGRRIKLIQDNIVQELSSDAKYFLKLPYEN